ncbi:MAG: nitroreductase family protein, partial [Candidatus Heimdallarchaeaceae archaeon]
MNTSSFIVISDNCIACEKCVDICPRSIFEINKNKAVTNSNIILCHDCGHCVAICPKDAIINYRMGKSLEEDFPMISDTVSHEQALLLLRQRRSIRQFKETPLNEEQIIKLIELGKYAPTGHNTRSVAYTVVLGREKIETILEEIICFFRDTVKKLHNPLWIFLAYLFGKKNSVKKAKKNEYRLISHITNYEQGTDKIFHNAPALLLIHVDEHSATPVEDCAIAAQNIMLGAPTLNLGATF